VRDWSTCIEHFFSDWFAPVSADYASLTLSNFGEVRSSRDIDLREVSNISYFNSLLSSPDFKLGMSFFLVDSSNNYLRVLALSNEF
jgi:hypothetical protein